MKKSGYVFFGLVVFVLAIPLIWAYLGPTVTQWMHSGEEEVTRVTAAAEIYIENHWPDQNIQVDSVRYSTCPPNQCLRP